MSKEILTSDKQILLQEARQIYGNKNQILVCMEELNELACVLAKYPRYSDEAEAVKDLKEKALDEYADVFIILDHVKHIFDLTDDDIAGRVNAKLTRLARWLSHSKSMQETVDDRTVIPETICSDCVHRILFGEEDYEDYCHLCHQAQATEGKAIFHLTAQEKTHEI